MVKRALMVAFHFPPQRGSSGIQRTLKFAQYLPLSGWQPLILTAHPRAHADTTSGPDGVPDSLVVRRAFALDTARHLAVRGRYTRLLALPDRWVSWCLGAVPAGLAMIRRYRPQVLWSTYPIASAHLIGLALHRLTGLPWVADLRDPMLDAVYPADPLSRRVAGWIEAKTIRAAARVVCTTPGAVRHYRQLFQDVPPERFCLIENGYDDEDFDAAEADACKLVKQAGAALTMLHSGIVYPLERDPKPLFAALAGLLRDGSLTPARFQLVLRAPVHTAFLQGLIEQYGIATLVTIAPPLPYRAALAEMLGADALLLLQAANCNDQVPAKLYEYLRANKPLLALTDPQGDTWAAVRAAGIDTLAPLDDAEKIGAALMTFIALAEAGSAPLAPDAVRRSHARSARTVQLAALLDAVVAETRQAAKSSKAP
ncbi:glycosyltransferase [Massilia sp. S19_KUP03_FR1]|uniref:glycosyltransferase n=1 Tax=Massilia sp. S19_KUP03_FR1 TaxID=3025503 RepID=UPI002FCDB952